MLRVLALPGAGVVPADTPVLRGDDLGALRGDGVFETLHVRQGEPWLLDEHLARMRRSAERLALPLPAEDEILAGTTVSWLLDHAGELGLRAERRMVRPAELHLVDGVWLASSVRGLVEVRSLDGAALITSPETSQLQKLLGY